ncbi:MAG: nucleoside deaminase [Lachnospiraceae bacterium]
MEEKYMKEALREAYDGIRLGHGGPFGSVIVKEGEIIGRGHNCVIRDNDPTMHGEVAAIRDACKKINSFDLSGSEIYTTAEPCPMCLGALLWAGVKTIYYGCNRHDTEQIGFRDNVFYEMMEDTGSTNRLVELDRVSCKELFDSYQKMNDKVMY